MNEKQPLTENFSTSAYSSQKWAHDYRVKYEQVIKSASLMAKRMNIYSDRELFISTIEELPKIIAAIEQPKIEKSGKLSYTFTDKVIFGITRHLPQTIRSYLAISSLKIFSRNLSEISEVAEDIQQYEGGAALTKGVDLQLLREAAKELDTFINSPHFAVDKSPPSHGPSL